MRCSSFIGRIPVSYNDPLGLVAPEAALPSCAARGIDMDQEEFAKIVYERWKLVMEDGRGPVRCHEAKGPLPSMLESLLPLAGGNTKILLARHGEWTAYIPNGWPNEGDIGTDAGYLSKTLNIRVVSMTLTKDVPRGQPGSTQLYDVKSCK